jgi:hypothetical protein
MLSYPACEDDQASLKIRGSDPYPAWPCCLDRDLSALELAAVRIAAAGNAFPDRGLGICTVTGLTATRSRLQIIVTAARRGNDGSPTRADGH